MAHLHFVREYWYPYIPEDTSSDIVDYLVFCSDYCHQTYTSSGYEGWNGCHEISTTQPCLNCGDTVQGLDED
jgi:hypothetical protein